MGDEKYYAPKEKITPSFQKKILEHACSKVKGYRIYDIYLINSEDIDRIFYHFFGWGYMISIYLKVQAFLTNSTQWGQNEG